MPPGPRPLLTQRSLTQRHRTNSANCDKHLGRIQKRRKVLVIGKMRQGGRVDAPPLMPRLGQCPCAEKLSSPDRAERKCHGWRYRNGGRAGFQRTTYQTPNLSVARSRQDTVSVSETGAGEGIRTLGPNLGKIFQPLFQNSPDYDYLRYFIYL